MHIYFRADQSPHFSPPDGTFAELYVFLTNDESQRVSSLEADRASTFTSDGLTPRPLHLWRLWQQGTHPSNMTSHHGSLTCYSMHIYFRVV